MRKWFVPAVAVAKDLVIPLGPITDAPYDMGASQFDASAKCYKPGKEPPLEQPATPMKGVYLETWNGDAALDGVAWDLITHAYISFAKPTVRCGIKVTDAVRDFTKKALDRAENNSRSVRPAVILALGGWADTRHFSWCSNNTARRHRLAIEIAKVVADLGVDGVDFDWEHPRVGGCLASDKDDVETSNCEKAQTDWMDFCAQPNSWHFHNEHDLTGYQQLLADVRVALGWKKHISFTLGIGGQVMDAWGELTDRFNFGDMCKYANYMQMMAYDYFGNWNDPRVTDHQSALFCDPESPAQELGSWPTNWADSCGFWPCDWKEANPSQDKGCAFPRLHTAGVIDWSRGPWEPVADASGTLCFPSSYPSNGYLKSICPPNRVAIGLAAYGRGFCGVNSSSAGEYEGFDPCDVADTEKPVFANYWQIKEWESDSSYTKYFNKRTQTPFLYNKDKQYWISYTDPEGITQITKYAMCRAMGGVFFWAASGDASQELQKAAFQAVDDTIGTTGTLKECTAKINGGPSETIDYSRDVGKNGDKPKYTYKDDPMNPLKASCCPCDKTPSINPTDSKLDVDSFGQRNPVKPVTDIDDDGNPDGLPDPWDPEGETGRSDKETDGGDTDPCGVPGSCNHGDSTSSSSSSTTNGDDSWFDDDDNSAWTALASPPVITGITLGLIASHHLY